MGSVDGVSGDTVRNILSLNNLVPELLKLVDEKKISLTPAYQIAALSEPEQRLLLETIDSEQATPSVSQAQRMRKLSQTGELNEARCFKSCRNRKSPQDFSITIPLDRLRKYFPIQNGDIFIRCNSKLRFAKKAQYRMDKPDCEDRAVTEAMRREFHATAADFRVAPKNLNGIMDGADHDTTHDSMITWMTARMMKECPR